MKDCCWMRKSGKDLTGRKFGRLTAIRRVEKPDGAKTRGPYWECLCDCLALVVVAASCLVGGSTQSCGCLRRELNIQKAQRNIRHGMSHTKIYHVWWSMMQRCYNPNHPSYAHYGGRGIAVCGKWHSLESFYEDMGHPPRGLSIERIDNNGNYCPENCKWGTNEEQNNNRSISHFVEYNGEKLTLSQCSRKFGINKHTLRGRLERGWSAERALTEPARRKNFLTI